MALLGGGYARPPTQQCAGRHFSSRSQICRRRGQPRLLRTTLATSRFNVFILFFMGGLSWHVYLNATPDDPFTAVGTNRTPRRPVHTALNLPVTHVSNNSSQLCSKLSLPTSDILKITTTASATPNQRQRRALQPHHGASILSMRVK